MPDEAASILSRAQRQGFGFGLRIPEEVDHTWSDYLPKHHKRTPQKKRIFTGFLNHRWPIVKDRIIDYGSPLVDIISCFYYDEGRMIQVTK